jgi:regulatory protein
MSNPAYNYALKALVRREHSAVELRKKMLLKEFDEDDIDNALQTLQQQKYQSDERFAESLVNTRMRQGKGYLMIIRELNTHQIENPEHYLQDIDFYELCLQVKIKKFGAKKYQDVKTKAKQMRFLQGRGFDFDAITHAIE